MNFLIHPSQNSYEIFYLLAFFASTLLIVFAGLKQDYKLRTILIVLSTTGFFTLLGSKLFLIPVSEWPELVLNGAAVENYDKSAIGGLLFGIVGLILSCSVLRTGPKLLRIYAWAIPLCVGIQKFGCLAYGCCYGTLTDLPIGIKYAQGSAAHFDHMTSGLIDLTATTSMPVHPVQLYEILLLISASLIIWKLSSKWGNALTVVISSLFLVFFFRFFAEFFRDPSYLLHNNTIIYGLKKIQWALILFCIILLLLIILSEKFRILQKNLDKRSIGTPKSELLYLFFLTAVIYLFRGLFDVFDYLSLMIKFIPATLLIAWGYYRSFERKSIIWKTALIVIMPLLLCSQMDPSKEKTWGSYSKVNVGFLHGHSENQIQYNPVCSGGCGGTCNYSNANINQNSNSFGAGYSYSLYNPKNEITFGANSYLGAAREFYTGYEGVRSSLLGLQPYIKYDRRKFGIGAGLHFGKLQLQSFEDRFSTRPLTTNLENNFFPSAYLRLGDTEKLDFTIQLANHLPSLPYLLGDLSIGSGFGENIPYEIRMGYLYPLNNFYFQIDANINNRFELKLNLSPREGNTTFLLGAGYRFNNK